MLMNILMMYCLNNKKAHQINTYTEHAYTRTQVIIQNIIASSPVINFPIDTLIKL